MVSDTKEQGLRIEKRYQVSDAQSYQKVSQKDSIILHHTGGTTAKGALDWWNSTPEKVGTAFVIDRDGTIYQAFDPARWGFHLGVKGDSNYTEKHSIGIEIVAAGPLYEEKDGYYFYPAYPKKISGKRIPDLEVEKIEYRGHKAFHKYTDAQIASVVELIKYLSKTFGIKATLTKGFYNFSEKMAKADVKEGIWSHSTFRKDKTDIYPCKALLEALKVFGK